MDLSNATDNDRNAKASEDRWVLWWKPVWITFGLGPLGLIAIFGQLWLPRLNSMLLQPFDKPYVSAARVLLVVLGAFLLMISSPIYRPAGWRPDTADEPDDAQ